MNRRVETSEERRIRRAINPRAPAELRVMLAYERGLARERQKWAAFIFLTEGEEAVKALKIKPPWGRKWNRDYNPLPYPEAKPRGVYRIEMFDGTGVGTLYGIMESKYLLYTLAGWNITQREPEVRRRRKW